MDLDLIRGFPAIHLQSVSDLTKNNLGAFIDRAFFKLGCSLVKYLKLENSLALGYGSYKYLKKSKIIKADLYICHQELATFIGVKLIKAGRRVVFDFEDWYSADLLPSARNARPISLLQKMESLALNYGSLSITTSQALAGKLAVQYSCKKPEVIYNVFPFEAELNERKKAFSNPLKLFWFSQTIGRGRGLEEFIFILQSIHNPLELHLLGNIDAEYKNCLSGLIGSRHGLFFHQTVPETELAAKIAGFDIGLAIELMAPPSRNYTVTNKFFQYLQSGLPVIATETEGQKEVFNKFKPGFMLPQKPNATQVKALAAWLNDPSALQEAAKVAKAAALVYSWENESKKLLRLINNAIKQ